MEGTTAKVKAQNELSEGFHIRNGLRQGDALACILFNIALKKITRDANVNQCGNIFYKSVQILAYADDIDITSRSSKFSPPSTLLPLPQLQTLANPKNAVLLSRC